MSVIMQPGRRRTLRWLIAGGLAATGARAGYLALRDPGTLGDADATEAAARLGETYLDQAPQEKDAEALSHAVFNLDLRGLTRLSPEAIRERIQTAMQTSYLAGDVVQLRDWWISGAEARLCALVYLLGKSGWD